MTGLGDIAFPRFTWQILDNDLAAADGRDSMLGIIYRWLLTEPASDPFGSSDEEVETRAAYSSSDERTAAYEAPSSKRLPACLPWDPTWGAGIKSYLSRPMNAALIAEVKARVRDGIGQLDGVQRVEFVNVSGSPSTLVIEFRIRTRYGLLEESFLIS